eukprot:CAMPEP_0195612114 /NCGR_PEP_ID=MMETSP0815-20121206/10695_1 /TAXON_ID=97485 /ORGANISM="Prymnesium parvum, Strain Texoma1" /LENGTH=102 /DNA_ID=CAMNT_0040752199 /DNA_START=409 /DNA_END=718 /DNA_ORIENTATION=+
MRWVRRGVVALETPHELLPEVRRKVAGICRAHAQGRLCAVGHDRPQPLAHVAQVERRVPDAEMRSRRKHATTASMGIAAGEALGSTVSSASRPPRTTREEAV